MRIHLKDLLRLPVVTNSGRSVGRVSDVEIDVENHALRAYIVSPSLFTKESLVIAPSQVQRITAKEIVVDDGVLTQLNSQTKKMGTPQPNLGGAMTRSE